MAALPYMQLYVADYLAEASHLSALQHGAYLLLLFNYWQRGTPLSNSNDRLANVARMSNAEWLEHRAVLAEFFEVEGDTWRHAGIEAALQAVADKSAKARGAGEASARKRAAPAEPIASERATAVQQAVNHTDKDKEKDSKQGEKPARASRLPQDWTPTLDDINFCRAERPDLDPQMTASRFRDYWCAVAGDKGRKIDWCATWRNWVRNEKPPSRAVAGQPGSNLGNAGQSTKNAALDWLGAAP